MFLAQTTPPAVSGQSLVATLDGVTTVLTAFIFVCLVLPKMVKHRPQFFMAFACVAGIIGMHTFSVMFTWFTFGAVVIGVLQLVCLLLLFLCVGGLTVRELGEEMVKSYEVLRRGETEKEVIIPINQAPKPRAAEAPPRKVYRKPVAPVVPADDDEDKGIPLS